MPKKSVIGGMSTPRAGVVLMKLCNFQGHKWTTSQWMAMDGSQEVKRQGIAIISRFIRGLSQSSTWNLGWTPQERGLEMRCQRFSKKYSDWTFLWKLFHLLVPTLGRTTVSLQTALSCASGDPRDVSLQASWGLCCLCQENWNQWNFEILWRCPLMAPLKPSAAAKSIRADGRHSTDGGAVKSAYMGVPNSWVVYNEKSIYKWMTTRGSPKKPPKNQKPEALAWKKCRSMNQCPEKKTRSEPIAIPKREDFLNLSDLAQDILPKSHLVVMREAQAPRRAWPMRRVVTWVHLPMNWDVNHRKLGWKTMVGG